MLKGSFRFFQMNRFQTLKLFIKALNYPCLSVSARQSFLTVSCSSQISKVSCHTNKKVTSDNSEYKGSAIDPVEDLDLSDYGSALMPSFNFAAYADTSPLLQELIKLGVNFYEIERKPGVDYILTLKWENIQKYLLFLTNNGVPPEKLGEVITMNPFIFKEHLDDLQVRINYLESKKFDRGMISNILVRNPKWLSVPVKTIDERLGFIQQSFEFSGDEVRQIITASPSLATISKKIIINGIYILKEDLNLDVKAARKMIVSEPQLLRTDPFDLVSTYDYLTKTMNVSMDLILMQPKVLTCRKFWLKERHLFLQSLGRAQYNNLLPGYVSLLDLIQTNDEEFCNKVAKVSIDSYDEFLKTL